MKISRVVPSCYAVPSDYYAVPSCYAVPERSRRHRSNTWWLSGDSRWLSGAETTIYKESADILNSILELI